MGRTLGVASQVPVRGGLGAARPTGVVGRARCLTAPLGLAFAFVFALTGCGKPTPTATSTLDPKAFDTQRAYKNVAQLVAFGPRPSGGLVLMQSAAWIKKELESYGYTVELQEFTAGSPRGPVQFRNLVARTARQDKLPDSQIIIGAHYDTKSFDNFKFVGANDGASGAGVLIELARVAAQEPNLTFVWFDGEEAMNDYGPEDGLWGSKFFVENLKAEGEVANVKALILLDMIGDANLNITIPGSSHPKLVQAAFDAAKAVGYRDFFSIRPTGILDDDNAFWRADIPAVNLIDFEFGSAPGLNDYWHTEKDTMDKVSPHSLEIAGQTALRLIVDLQSRRSLR